ncbi:MAG: FHA domain-containing protein [Thermoguttaceae bacterium]|nr:FHA domain-containing protein [Thermoguttaceae bacterium]MDW8039672.1 FHA domain-containing protein [Thermoguttaceae bacterium]
MAILPLDPRECIQARDCLQRGLLAEAARVLLGAKDRHHRKVQALLQEVGSRLIAEAKRLYESSYELEVAAQHIQLASQCIQLDSEALVLKHQIEQQLDKRRRAEQWRQEQLRRAKQLADNGHLHTAQDLLNILKEDRQADRLRAEIRARFETYRRHLEGIEQCLAQNQPHAAYRHWQEAKKLCPHAPELAEWAQKIAQHIPVGPGPGKLGTASVGVAFSAQAGALQPVPLCQRSQSFLLGEWALVISSGQICIGSPRAVDVQLPLLGRVHQRHALLLRDVQGWQILPLPDQNGTACPVWLNGVLILGPQRIHHGDKITLGGSPASGSCSWQFQLPVTGSLSAVLESSPGNSSIIYLPPDRLTKAVLLADMLVVSASPPAHLVVSDLPCQRLLLRWESDGLCWQVEGGRARLEIPGQTIDQADRRLYLGGRLVIESALDEAELLGRAAVGAAPPDQVTLELKSV